MLPACIVVDLFETAESKQGRAEGVTVGWVNIFGFVEFFRQGVKNEGACVFAHGRRPCGGGYGRGSPPPAGGSGGVTPGKFLKNHTLNPAF